MAYEIYKKVLSQEDYFNNWDSDSFKKLPQDLHAQIYDKYVVKCTVFNRDNFKCQNEKCTTPLSELTMHHVKWQKNGGVNKSRNCVTLCKTCHKAFHRAKKSITFYDDEKLPTHIRGHTFAVNVLNEIDWKKIKKEMKILRKNLKTNHGLVLSGEQIMFLMKWLEYVVSLDDEI